MSFQQGLSGLNAAAKNLDSIGNNVANSTTVGFKQSQVQFADVYANQLSGSEATKIGIGVRIAAVTQQFTQGNITATNNPMDIAINGGGFFRMDSNGSISYQRNGQFKIDSNGYIVSPGGGRLTGYPADPNGILLTGALVADAAVVEDPSPMKMVYDPKNPLADDKGFVTMPNVNVVEEMVNMISASRSYQSNVEMMNTAKTLLAKTLTLGQ